MVVVVVDYMKGCVCMYVGGGRTQGVFERGDESLAQCISQGLAEGLMQGNTPEVIYRVYETCYY